MVLGAFPPGVVGHLVVIPDSNKGMRGVRGLQIRVPSILPVAGTVVRQAVQLGWRLHFAAELLRPGAGIPVPGVLVEVVPQVQHRVQFLAGDLPVHIEIPCGVV